MAVNKNFVVKNGLEVDTNTLFVDSANNRVAIGTTVPTASLDVRGKILSDSQVESWVGKFVGIVTAGAVGVTTLTYSVGTGSSTKLGRANAEELNVTAGFTTVQSMSATDIIVSVGSTFSKDVNIGAAATVGAALTVTGGAKIALDSRFEKALEVGEDLNVGAAATITGISTFTGAAKFASNSRFEKSLAVGEDLNVGSATTVGGALTAADGIDVNTIRGATNNSNVALGARASNGAHVISLTLKPDRTATFDGGVGIADSIFHIGDDNTQLRFPSADNFTVETGGSERLRVNSSGLVGIGTDTIQRNLVVNGGTSEGVIQITNATSGGSQANGFELIHFTSGETQLLNRENNAMRFDTNNTERVRITAAGLVGIATATPRDSSTLDVDGGGRFNGDVSFSGSTGAGSTVLFDQSDNSLKFVDSVKA